MAIETKIRSIQSFNKFIANNNISNLLYIKLIAREIVIVGVLQIVMLNKFEFIIIYKRNESTASYRLVRSLFIMIFKY